jgi:hypothetical protein
MKHVPAAPRRACRGMAPTCPPLSIPYHKGSISMCFFSGKRFVWPCGQCLVVHFGSWWTRFPFLLANRSVVDSFVAKCLFAPRKWQRAVVDSSSYLLQIIAFTSCIYRASPLAPVHTHDPLGRNACYNELLYTFVRTQDSGLRTQDSGLRIHPERLRIYSG